ncbi:MAG: arylsulfatase family protein [Verrucomicrobiales bacterium]|nr:arylsulfatase family protein [Verrucomicrobiales bacterium]
MNIKQTLLLLCAVTIGATLHAAEKPDIVFILADDLGYNDVGFAGGKEIKTPNLDKLAAGGTVLKQFYVQPVCSPTRASLMTGRYPMRYGLQVGVIRPWANYGLPLEEQMLPDALRSAGYSTTILGKWHLGSFDKAYAPTNRGFEHHYGHLFGAIDYFTHERDGKLDWYRDGEVLKEKGYSTHLIASEAERVIKAQPKNKPLFLYVPFNAVHAPHEVPESYKEPYKNLPEPRRTYAGMLAALDEGVGKIVAAIDSTGRRKNTLFIFSSDNGGPAPGKVTDNTPFRAGKGTLYEGGVRVCAFVAWDGHIKAGTSVNEPLHMVDWYPTLSKLTHASVKQKLPLDGLDAWPTIAKGKRSPHDAILFNSTPYNGAIRIGDWKLVLAGNHSEVDGEAPDAKVGKKAGSKRMKADLLELFNLRDDPSETKNLADANPGKVKELRERYEVLAKQAATPKNLKE